MSKAEKNRMCVGVDLHKTQFTVCALDEGTGTVELECEFRTNADGYEDFINRIHEIESERGNSIELAVDSTGNARLFKNKMEYEGFRVVVVNTNKFKVITMSTKKNDANDAATLAFYLLKEMLPESHLCDQTSEEIRRMLKTRSILVQATVKMKNQIHGMMLGYGIIRQPQNTSEWKLMIDYHRMKKEKGSGRAIIALTRKVARIVFVMLSKQKEFNPALMIREKTKLTA